jgi:hypothetical protein
LWHERSQGVTELIEEQERWLRESQRCSQDKLQKSKLKLMCSHCGIQGHKESNCWNKYFHKAPSKGSAEASRTFLDKELLVCNIIVDDTCFIAENVEDAYYCDPIVNNRQWMNLESQMGLEDLFIANPYKGFIPCLHDRKHPRNRAEQLTQATEMSDQAQQTHEVTGCWSC